MPNPPKSTEEHRAAGTYQASRHAPMKLNPTDNVPKPPAWLSKDARAKWREAALALSRAGVLTLLDLDALAAYCVAYATWRAALDIIAKEGETYESGTGDAKLKKLHPAVGMMQQADRAMRDWASRLGLHPESRKRLRIEVKQNKLL